MIFFWVGVVGGAAAFAHCLGMCGGLALQVARSERRGAQLADQLLWHAGKTSSYVFLGALSGFLGASLTVTSTLSRVQNLLAWIAGAIMILLGFKLLGLWPRRATARGAGEGLLSSLFGAMLRPGGSPATAFVLGLGTGFLPCPVVLGFLTLSLQSGSVSNGMLTMAGVGVGTLWSLLLVGVFGQLVNARLRRWGAPIGGVVLVLVGAVTLLRPVPAFHHLLGCPHALVRHTAQRYLPSPAAKAAPVPGPAMSAPGAFGP